MGLSINPVKFLTAVKTEPAPMTMVMATVQQSTPLLIQFDTDVGTDSAEDYYPDAILAVAPVVAGQRVIVTRIANRWVITNIIASVAPLTIPDLTDITIPKYASGAARDAAQPSPADNNLASVGNDMFYYQSPVTGTFLPFGPTKQAFRTSTLSIGAATTYCSIASVNPGTYHITASIGIDNPATAVLTSAKFTFSGTATAQYSNWAFNISGGSTVGATVGATTVGQAFGSSSAGHFLFMFDGTLIVTVSGTLALVGSAASGTRTADGGGYIQLQKWV